MVDLSADRERVLKKVIEEPGLPVALIEWKLAQEGFGLSFEGKATVTLTYEMLQKFKKVGARLTDLKNADKVKQEPNNRGYYPDVRAGKPQPTKQEQRQQAEEARYQRRYAAAKKSNAKAREAAMAEAMDSLKPREDNSVDLAGF